MSDVFRLRKSEYIGLTVAIDNCMSYCGCMYNVQLAVYFDLHRINQCDPDNHRSLA